MTRTCWSWTPLLAIMLATASIPSLAADPAGPIKMDPARRLAARTAQSLESARERRLTALRFGGQEYSVLHIEFRDAATCAAFQMTDVTPLTRFDRFATVFVPRENQKVVEAVGDAPGVVWIDQDETAQAPPPPQISVTNERPKTSEIIARGGVGGLTGKGVIVAIIDSGIDYHNPEFIDASSGQLVSRLLAYWDTLDDTFDRSGGKVGIRPSFAYPNKASIGTIYTRDQLSADLRSPSPRIAEPDAEGHGTACAAVAAGNGRCSMGKYLGVAPAADLIGVRVSSGPQMENAYLLGAVCEWLDQIARREGRPLVINCSFASQGGGHDGCRIEEREIDARFPATAKGRAICIAAGNEDEDGMHSRVQLNRTAAQQQLQWVAIRGGRRGPRSADIALFVDGVAPDAVTVQGDGVKVVARYIHPFSRSSVLDLEAPAQGTLQVSVTGNRGATVDAYVYGDAGKVRFTDKLCSRGQLIGSPGLAHNAVTVGSYDFNDGFDFPDADARLDIFPGGKPSMMQVGAISAYSNRGYSRRGDTKPDLAAPGQYHIVPAVPATEKQKLPRDKNGKLTIFNGTSAATPYTAGVIALMLEKDPSLTVGQVKDLLHKHASHDTYVGDVPNATWGYGKLDLEAIKAVIGAIEK
jgi:subtilisin family serine protease